MANKRNWSGLLDRHLDLVATWYDSLSPAQEITFGLIGLAATCSIIIKTAIILGGN
jgi:uncharacterized membrane protein YuzA (DUF378 family)